MYGVKADRHLEMIGGKLYEREFVSVKKNKLTHSQS
jgi:hypothetical protein